jgi:LasA protease
MYRRLALFAAMGLGVTLLATPARAAPVPLDDAVIAAMEARTGQTRAAVAAEARAYRVTTTRQDQGWAFGIAILRAAYRPGDYPQGWLFLARHDSREWTVALDSTAGFSRLAAAAPASVFGVAEKAAFAVRDVSLDSGGTPGQTMSNNTGLRLPFQVGQSWTLTGGPHGWVGTERPFSAIDLTGGDGAVRSGSNGTVYTMCADSSGGAPGGWRRVYHANGYTTDYYHLSNLTTWADGATLGGAKKLGNIGRNVCAGGSATGAHVHWGLLVGSTRVSWHRKSAGQWVFWEGGAAYGGFALHGSTQKNPPSGQLYNYGKLPVTSGIVDAWGSGTVNRRSGPGSGFPVVGTLTDGQVVTISCWRNGTSHTGRYGTTSVWNKLPDGSWFSDAFAYTGVDTGIGPNC